jgi:Vitamin K epoxide reductase family
MSKFPWKTMLAVSALLAATAYAFAQISSGGPKGMHGQMQQGDMMSQKHSQMMQGQGGMHGGMGSVSSIYFMYLQLGFIREICSYCLISAVTSFLLLFAALWHFQVTRHPAIK